MIIAYWITYIHILAPIGSHWPLLALLAANLLHIGPYWLPIGPYWPYWLLILAPIGPIGPIGSRQGRRPRLRTRVNIVIKYKFK